MQASNNNKPLKGIDNLDLKYYIRGLEIIKKDLIKKESADKNVYLFTDMFKNNSYSNIIQELKII